MSQMSMLGVGLRDVFVVAPASSFHQDSSTISFDPLPQHTNNSSNAATMQSVGVGLIPLLAATPCLAPTTTTGIDGDEMDSYRSAAANLLKCGGGDGGGGAGATVCQECGNQAKKDCNHGRCRTCCKSRGFDCATHLKSTWIPASRRREQQSTSSSSGSKKQRLLTCQTGTVSEHTSTANTTTTRSFNTSSWHQDASFKETLPGQVSTSAVFKCLRLTPTEDDENEYAYQAVVKIGGHVFKGVLYDKGAKNGFPNIAELHLGGTNAGGRNAGSYVC